MSHPKQNLHEFLDQSFTRFRDLPSNGVESACDRVLDRLKKETDRAPEAVDLRPHFSRRYGRLVVLIAATAAAAVFAQRLATRTSPPAPPVKKEVVVGPRAAETAALVQQSRPEAPPSPQAVARGRLEFAAASLKPIAAGTMLPGAGLACHGTDGVQRLLLTSTTEGQNAVKAAQGRCVGVGIFLSTLIELAYGFSPRHILSGPDWAKTTGFITYDTYRGDRTRSGGGGIATLPSRMTNEGFAWMTKESFQFEAIADYPSTATLDQLRQMLQSMLTDRFNLKAHRERREVPGYSLVVAEKGSKLTPISGDYAESLVPYQGKSTLDKLAHTLSSVLLDEPPVVDKTGLKGAYEYELRLFPLTPLGGGNRGAAPPTLTERAENLSAALQDQLGLRLQPEKAVSVEVLIIDSVEPPSPN